MLVRERAQLDHATAETRAAAQARRDELELLRTDLDAASPRAAELATEIAVASTDAESARRAVCALAAVRVPEDLREVVQQIDDARSKTDDTAATTEVAEARAMEAEAALEQQPALDALRAAAEAHISRAALSARIEKGRAVRAEQAVVAEAAKDALIAATERFEQTHATLEDAQHRHAHAALRASLQVGEPCPVCDQDVARLPPKLRATELEQARKVAAAATGDREATERAAQAALNALSETGVRLDGLEEQLSAFDARVTTYPDAVALAALVEATEAVHERAVAARNDATTARRVARDAAKVLATFDTALARAEAALQEQRDGLVAAGLEPPRPTRGGLAARWDSLVAWTTDTRPEHEKRAAELDDIARAKSAERDAMLGDLLQRAIAVGVDAAGDHSVGGLTLAVAGAQHDADEALRTVERRLARAGELDAAIAAEREQELLAAELGRLLDKRHFGQWLVDEALGGLVAGASELLDRLSGGQYALTTSPDGDLLVVDRVNADETRSVRSLSGGETFQASLALALALADRIADLAADGAATLESIFLDEGFGTLDPETLDVVAGTIESLGGGERVVGIVTHVPALADRMPVRFRVRKVGRTSTVTREET